MRGSLIPSETTLLLKNLNNASKSMLVHDGEIEGKEKHVGEMQGKEMHGKINRGQGSQNGLQANRLKAGSQQNANGRRGSRIGLRPK